MDSSELFEMINKLPPDSRKEVEALVDALSNQGGKVKAPREFGSLKGFITYIADDFDAPPEDFKDYM